MASPSCSARDPARSAARSERCTGLSRAGGQGRRQSATCLQPNALRCCLPHRERPMGDTNGHVHARETDAPLRRSLACLTGDRVSTRESRVLMLTWPADRQTEWTRVEHHGRLFAARKARVQQSSAQPCQRSSTTRCRVVSLLPCSFLHTNGKRYKHHVTHAASASDFSRAVRRVNWRHVTQH